MQNGLGDQLLQSGRKQQRERTTNQHNNDDDPSVAFGPEIPLAHVGKHVQSSNALAVHGHFLEYLKIPALKTIAVFLQMRRK